MDPSEPLPAVGETALGIAMVRAVESRRADRLFEDAYAQYFAQAAQDVFGRADVTTYPPASLPAELLRDFTHGVVIRTRFFDDYLIRACAGGVRQVVLLAAGVDTRAYRLGWPAGTRVFECDLPPVLAFKDRVMGEHQARPRCERITIAVDLTADWPAELLAAGFDPSAPTAWLAEGLLFYLSDADTARLLGRIRRLSAPGSSIAFEHETIAGRAQLARANSIPGLNRYAALWKGGLGPDTAAFLRGQGWLVTTHERTALASDYGRPAELSGTIITALRRPSDPPARPGA
jgi:methyltransferase (TIGR00027 family)